MDKLFLPEDILLKYTASSNLSGKIKALLTQQKETWELLRTGYDSLETVQTRVFDFDNFEVKVQFNPGRIRSTNAKVDAKSIKERPCFLCKENLPEAQRAIKYNDKFIILCNPFPIFPEHFTIPQILHTPQLLVEHLDELAELSKDLSNHFTVFYNGPKCGASAPDHMHFQAGNNDFMPIDSEYENLKDRLLFPTLENNKLKIYYSQQYLRNFISIESIDKESLLVILRQLISLLGDKNSNNEEPMVNVLSSYVNSIWRVIVFPRKSHRPKQFFATDSSKLMISPASVDLGGVLITPREEDFNKITSDDIIDIYEQVGSNDTEIKNIAESLTQDVSSL